jgi:hypothetical protein
MEEAISLYILDVDIIKRNVSKHMKTLICSILLVTLTSCSYNIDNSVGGNVTTTTSGNNFRGASVPVIVNRPVAYGINPAAISAFCYTPPFYGYGWYRPWGTFWW